MEMIGNMVSIPTDEYKALEVTAQDEGKTVGEKVAEIMTGMYIPAAHTRPQTDASPRLRQLIAGVLNDNQSENHGFSETARFGVIVKDFEKMRQAISARDDRILRELTEWYLSEPKKAFSPNGFQGSNSKKCGNKIINNKKVIRRKKTAMYDGTKWTVVLVDVEVYPPMPVPKRLRQLALARDGHKCTACGYTGAGLSVHHIDKNHDNNQLDNLTILCRSCHGKVPKKKTTPATPWGRLAGADSGSHPSRCTCSTHTRGNSTTPDSILPASTG